MDRMNKEIQLDKMEKEWERSRINKEKDRVCQGQQSNKVSQGQNSMRNKMIRKGDRIFARLTMGARTVIEFMIDKVESMTDLLLEVHRVTTGMRGLCKLYVRNQSRGWVQERPLMLYGTRSAAASSSTAGSPNVRVATSSFSYYSHMQFPWETH